MRTHLPGAAPSLRHESAREALSAPPIPPSGPPPENQPPTIAIDLNGTAYTGDTLVNSYTASSQYGATIAALADGGYVVAWHSNLQDGSGVGIYAQRYDAAGVPQGAEARVNTHTLDYQTDPSIAGLAGGGYVVTWSAEDQDGSMHGVYAQRYDANGVAQGGETLVNTYTAGNQFTSTVAALAGGGYVIAWTSVGQDGSANGIFAQRYDANGTRLGPELAVNTYTANSQSSPTITSLAGGGFVVAWESLDQDGSEYGVFAQRFTASGAAVGPEVRVSTTTAGTQHSTAAAGLAGGGYVIVWNSAGQDGSSYGIYMQRYDASGVPQGAETRVNTVTASHQVLPEVVGLAGGGYVVTWQSYNQESVNAYGIYAQRYDANGVALGAETQVNSYTAGTQGFADVAALASGG